MEYKEYKLNKVKQESERFLNAKKNQNENTFINYRASINYFIYYVENVIACDVVSSDNINQILESFKGSLLAGFEYNNRTVKIKSSGVNTHLRRVKSFLKKCLGLKSDVKYFDEGEPKYKALTVKEIELLINECNNVFKSNEIAVRNAILIRFLFNTALRINEALTLKEENVIADGNEFYIKIHEKGKPKDQLTGVAISEKTYNSLIAYMDLKAVKSDFVFSTTRTSKDGKAKPLARENFNADIRKLANYVDKKHATNISDIISNNSSHVFRHSRAIYLLKECKADVVTVKKILRHKSINSTLIYLNPNDDEIKEVRINNDI